MSAPVMDSAPEPVFAAVITPHRSLGRRGFRALMLVLGAVMLVGGIRFTVMGFWPVIPFLVLDVGALYLAFRINYARARAFEEVVLTPLELLLRRVSHRGEAREWRLNPLWTRIDRQHDDEFGLMRLSLVSRGQSLVIASELSPLERESFADALSRALAEVKRGY